MRACNTWCGNSTFVVCMSSLVGVGLLVFFDESQKNQQPHQNTLARSCGHLSPCASNAVHRK